MLGLTTLSGAPISTSFFNPNVIVNVSGNALSIGIGDAIATTNATANPTGSQLTLGRGNVIITGTALVNPTGSQVIANTGEPGIITWNEIIPGVNMTWTEIEPY